MRSYCAAANYCTGWTHFTIEPTLLYALLEVTDCALIVALLDPAQALSSKLTV